MPDQVDNFVESQSSAAPGKAAVVIASQFVPIPGFGVAVALAMALASRGEATDANNARAMQNAALNNTLVPLANATLARNYDQAIQYFPDVAHGAQYYYDVSVAKAPATANAWYAAVLGYALEHEDTSYMLTLARAVDQSENDEIAYYSRDDTGGGE